MCLLYCEDYITGKKFRVGSHHTLEACLGHSPTTHYVKGGAELPASLKQGHTGQDVETESGARHGHHQPTDIAQMAHVLATDEREDDVVVLLALVAINSSHLTRNKERKEDVSSSRRAAVNSASFHDIY